MSRKLELEHSIIHYDVCGSGPPVLLLHGYPTNRKIWTPLADLLSERYTCVMPDLRGYGQSIVKNSSDINEFSKSNMAIDQNSLMDELGFDVYSVVGHDRGARVAYSLALDHPGRIKNLTVMDIIPTYELITRFNWQSSQGVFHWSFCAADDGWPEFMIGSNPNDFLRRTIYAWTGQDFLWAPEMISSFQKDFTQESVIHATCQDFRCFATVDFEEDQRHAIDKVKIKCPTMVLWGSHSLGKNGQSPLTIWEDWCENLVGYQVNSGHFLPAENPQSCFSHLYDFIAA